MAPEVTLGGWQDVKIQWLTSITKRACLHRYTSAKVFRSFVNRNPSSYYLKTAEYVQTFSSEVCLQPNSDSARVTSFPVYAIFRLFRKAEIKAVSWFLAALRIKQAVILPNNERQGKKWGRLCSSIATPRSRRPHKGTVFGFFSFCLFKGLHNNRSDRPVLFKLRRSDTSIISTRQAELKKKKVWAWGF